MWPPAEFPEMPATGRIGACARDPSALARGGAAVLVNGKGVLAMLAQKHYDEGSAFTPENLLREARRQKARADAAAPSICVLDPDGDLVRRVRSTVEARLDASWSCYHTELYRLPQG